MKILDQVQERIDNTSSDVGDVLEQQKHIHTSISYIRMMLIESQNQPRPFYKPKWLGLVELLPESIYKGMLPDKMEMAWMLFDGRILYSGDQLRDVFGPVYVNTWSEPYNTITDADGEVFNYSGFRPFDCRFGVRYSQHKFGRALDLKFIKYSAQEVIDYILNNSKLFPFISRIEVTVNDKPVTWVHIDCANVNYNSNIIQLHI